MAGEGLGGRIDPDTWEERYQTSEDDHDVVVLGDFIIDYVIPVDDEVYEEMGWPDEDWFPERGASEEVDDVPDEVRDYADDVLPGGRSPNQAVAASKSGAETLFAGRVGAEDYALDDLEDEVDAMLEQDGSRTTGQAYIFLEEDGENSIACVKDGDGLIDESYVDRFEDELMDAEYLLVSGGMPHDTLDYALELLEGRDDRPHVVLDPSPVDGVDELLEYDTVDTVTPNEVEYAALEDELDDGDYDVIRTSGDGAELNGEYAVEAPDVDVEDTTGAGDTFNGYLAGGLAQGMAMEKAMEYAVNAASLSVTRPGAMPSIPDADEVDAMLEA
ncbi:MAG: PfkB family carbohydrate kinase [Candidatus Nanohaloarchaea archaeon]|nr:PfkB family carbohydrate kinase [Candidatus Nanohaloarchaea archaeon]